MAHTQNFLCTTSVKNQTNGVFGTGKTAKTVGCPYPSTKELGRMSQSYKDS